MRHKIRRKTYLVPPPKNKKKPKQQYRRENEGQIKKQKGQHETESLPWIFLGKKDIFVSKKISKKV